MNFDTPVLLVDLSKLENNIIRMQKIADDNHLKLRPHTKTHKSPEIAKIQLQAGAKGITVAKLGEAEIMAKNGFNDILIANIIIGDFKFKRMIELIPKLDYFCTCVDSAEAVEMTQKAFKGYSFKHNLMIEINSGLNRAGIKEIDQILKIADKISSSPNLCFKGILTHGGHSYNAGSIEEIKQIGHMEGQMMVEIGEKLKDSGLICDEISVGSTPTAEYASEIKGITEIRPGNYVFFDMTQVAIGSASVENCALSILAQVISKPEKGRAVIDSGHKTLALDKAPVNSFAYDGFGFVLGKNAKILRLSEEHGVIEFENENFEIGEKIRIIPNHACAVMNLHNEFILLKSDGSFKQLEIATRGKVI